MRVDIMHRYKSGKRVRNAFQKCLTLPVVLTKKEVRAVFQHLSDVPRLVAALLYGAGLPISKALRLRVKDIDFEFKQIQIRSGKGQKDRITVLPDFTAKALHRKYPAEATKLKGQYLFPSYKISTDPRSGLQHRHHISDSFIQREVKKAVDRSKLTKHATCHTLRHSFATYLLKTATTSAPCKSCWATKMYLLR